MIAAVVIAVIAAVVVVLVSNKKIKTLRANNEILLLENESLAQYRHIVDVASEARGIRQNAEMEASRIKAKAEGAASEIKDEAVSVLAHSQQEADAIKEQVKSLLENARRYANSTMDTANTRRDKIIEDANKRAEEIAGEAVNAMNNAEFYKKTAQAMKNIVEGYGDKYVVSTNALLDELAEQYGFDDAGASLKNAIEYSDRLSDDGRAADCDYVEAHRRITAILFVLHAFNGAVDAILSKAKHDNFGTLERKIKDEFQVVNYNGRAFRNARILDDYLASKIDILKWAVAVHELRQREKEEQRRIKEQIREEERAQREFERSMREAAKQEETLRKEMEKVEERVKIASEEQKAKYEEQLALLAEKLKEAEERNQRAKSMAEQTKAGHVYIISNIGSFGEDVYKIGLTRRLEPLDRVRELGDASVPFAFDVHAMIFSENSPALEHALHKHFIQAQVNKVNPRKEFFRVPIAEIKKELDKQGIKTVWTITAEAREYRESLAIEKSINENPARAEEWLRGQRVYGIESSFDEDSADRMQNPNDSTVH